MTSPGSLQTLDVLVGGSIEEAPRSAPPAAPVLGSAYLVAPGATGQWAGKSHCVAAWTGGGWRFIAPVEGMSLYERSSGTCATYRNGTWEIGTVRASALQVGGVQVVGPQGQEIAAPAGGSVIDVQARSSIDAILNALRSHGLIAP